MSPAPRGQNARKIALRYLFFTLGLLINSFGIGTVVSALIVGPLVSLFGRVLPGLGRIRALAICRKAPPHGGLFLYLNGIAQNHAAICCQTGRPTSQRMSGTNSSAGR